MKPAIKFIIVSFIVWQVLACRKNNAVIGNDNPPASFSEVFDIYWNEMNANYVFWDVDTTDWDAVYRQYKPVFAQLDLNNDNDVKKSVSLFRQMTERLIDGHYFISFENNAISDSSVYPAYERKRKKAGFHNPFPYVNVVLNYLDSGYMSGFDLTTDPSKSLYALAGTIDHEILYFTCNNFSLFKSYNSTAHNDVKPVINHFIGNLHNSSIRGIIIDVRGNPGGDLSDLNFLVGSLIDQPLHFGYTRYKSGDGRLDLTPWVKAVVNPLPGARAVNIPVIVLVDNFTGSLAELIAIAISSLPNGFVVGENTWGATGPITNQEVYNSGQFSIKDFLSVLTASAMFKYLDDKIYEGIGFPPDFLIPFNKEMLNQGVDQQLEKAISLID
jgi:carboxyl-terminal processing protease